MAGISKRDKCFAEAVDAYNDLVPDDRKIKIFPQTPWTIDATTGKWRPIATMEQFWDWVKDIEVPYRVPDWTLEVNGNPVAGDNKFKGDRYSNRRSPRTGNTQLEDQNQMNQDIHPDKEEYQDLNLNPENCNCSGDPQPQEAYELAPERVFVPGFNALGEPVMPPLFESLPSFGPVVEPTLTPEFFPDFVFW
jgi:hypothetical protein